MGHESVTEILHLFAASYEPGDHTHPSGGVHNEREDIDVLELPFNKAMAMAMVGSGAVRNGKKIMLLQPAALVGLSYL